MGTTCAGQWKVRNGHHDKHFSIDCYSLALGSYDIQWLESLGPILLDFRNRTMAFVRNGHHVRWAMEGAAPEPTLLAVEGDLMEELLLCFHALFAELSGLPLEWERCHHTPVAGHRPCRSPPVLLRALVEARA
jgi:hypothetical protein